MRLNVLYYFCVYLISAAVTVAVAVVTAAAVVVG